MRKIYNILVLVIDIVLLCVIISSAKKAGREDKLEALQETAAFAEHAAEPEVPQEPAYADHTAEAEASQEIATDQSDFTQGQEDYAQGQEDYAQGQEDYTQELEGYEQEQENYSQGVEQFEQSGGETGDGTAASDVMPEMVAGFDEEDITLEDFDWYESDVRLNWFPEEAVQFQDFQRMKGKWRAYIKFDPKNEAGRRTDILLHIYISGDEENVTAEYDWYWIHNYNDPEGRYDDDETSYYYGKYEDGEIYAEGAGNVTFRYFYEWDEEEYAIGVMESRAGVKAILCMMR